MSNGKSTITDIGSRGRVTIPKEIRKKLGVSQGDFVKLDVKKAEMNGDRAKEDFEKQGRPPKKTRRTSKSRDRNRYNVFEG